VYLNYGMHCLVNAVTEPEGSPAAVLIRALAPLEGIDGMRRRRANGRGRLGSRRPAPADIDLCRGPGNLTKALGIDLRQNQLDLTGGALTIEDHARTPDRLTWSPRIGIRVGRHHAWRCYWSGHPSVSGASGPV
jgi:DNA-3-methyladenine glycosylase